MATSTIMWLRQWCKTSGRLEGRVKFCIQKFYRSLRKLACLFLGAGQTVPSQPPEKQQQQQQTNNNNNKTPVITGLSETLHSTSIYQQNLYLFHTRITLFLCPSPHPWGPNGRGGGESWRVYRTLRKINQARTDSKQRGSPVSHLKCVLI